MYRSLLPDFYKEPSVVSRVAHREKHAFAASIGCMGQEEGALLPPFRNSYWDPATPLLGFPGCGGSPPFRSSAGGWRPARGSHLYDEGRPAPRPWGEKDLSLSLLTLSEAQLAFIIIILGLGIKRPIKTRA